MAGLNQRFRASSGKITLPRAFAEQQGASIVAAHKVVSDIINMDHGYPTGNELKYAVSVASAMPYAGVAFDLPFQDKHDRVEARDRTSLGKVVIRLAEGARMVFDPVHAKLCRDLRKMMSDAQRIETIGIPQGKQPKLQGPVIVALRKMTLEV